MKKLVSIAILSFGIVFAGFTQTKGPAYKNAKPSEKYKGTTEVLVRENPNQFKGAEFKNLDKRKFEIEIKDLKLPGQPDQDLVASTDSVLYSNPSDNSEKIIYRRLDTKDMKGKNSLKLKGPAYKNYKN